MYGSETFIVLKNIFNIILILIIFLCILMSLKYFNIFIKFNIFINLLLKCIKILIIILFIFIIILLKTYIKLKPLSEYSLSDKIIYHSYSYHTITIFPEANFINTSIDISNNFLKILFIYYVNFNIILRLEPLQSFITLLAFAFYITFL